MKLSKYLEQLRCDCTFKSAARYRNMSLGLCIWDCAFADSECPDQTAHPRSLIRASLSAYKIARYRWIYLCLGKAFVILYGYAEWSESLLFAHSLTTHFPVVQNKCKPYVLEQLMKSCRIILHLFKCHSHITVSLREALWLSRSAVFHTKSHVRPAKTQISLRIRSIAINLSH